MPKTNYQYAWSTAVRKAKIELKGREGKLAADGKRHEKLGMQVLDKEVAIDRSDETISGLQVEISDLQTRKLPIADDRDYYKALVESWHDTSPPSHKRARATWIEEKKRAASGGMDRVYQKGFIRCRNDVLSIEKEIDGLNSRIAAENKTGAAALTALRKLRQQEDRSFQALRAGQADLAEFQSILDHAVVENVQKALKGVDALDGTAKKCLAFQSHATVWPNARSELGNHRGYPEIKAILDTLNDIAADVAALENGLGQVRASTHDLGSFALFSGNARNDLKHLTGVVAVGGLKINVRIETPDEALDGTVSLALFKKAAAAAATAAQASAKTTLTGLNSAFGEIAVTISEAQADLRKHEEDRQRVQAEADRKQAVVEHLTLEIENGVHYKATGNRLTATKNALTRAELNKRTAARTKIRNTLKTDELKFLKDAPGKKRTIEQRKATAQRDFKTGKTKAASVPGDCLAEIGDAIVAAVHGKWAGFTAQNAIYSNYAFDVIAST